MAVGDEARVSVRSYCAVFLETTYGTYPATAATNATAIEPLAIDIKTDIKSEMIESLYKFRGHIKRVQLDKEVVGTVEHYLHPHESVRLIATALGGGISSTVTSNVATHTLTVGNFDTNNSSISLNVRKGETNVFGYTGGRVNVLKLSANVGEPVKVSYEMIFKDSTFGITDIGSSLSISSTLPFTYVQGFYSYADTETNANTTTAREPITGFELSINNNMKSDKDARALGSNVLSVLPATRRKVDFKVMQRFDTSTTWNRFIQATQGAVQLLFQGATITTGSQFECMIRMPKVFMNTTDPNVGGPNDLLISEINFDVLVDNPDTSTGKDIWFQFINTNASYAA